MMKVFEYLVPFKIINYYLRILKHDSNHVIQRLLA